MHKNSKIYISGHNGFVGSHLLSRLIDDGYENLVYRTRSELDLTNQRDVSDFFDRESPEYVFICAAKVGGIGANMKDPYGFLLVNLQIQNNLIENSMKHGCKVLFLGSSCIYPKDYIQPLREDYLLAAPLEPTNEGYSLAKICGLKLCEYASKQHGARMISLMPCNLFGPGDDYDPENSHVLSAMIKKIVDAKINDLSTVDIWGSGEQRREFLFIDDVIDSMIWSITNLECTETFLNVGTGEDISIIELANEIANIVEYHGGFICNTNKPDGMKLKCLDVSKIHSLGWKHSTSLREGLKKSIDDYLDTIGERI